MGCSTQVVPSWSKVAMRSSGGTNFGLFLSVVVLTKSRIACFAGPSFQDGSGSAKAVAAGWFGAEVPRLDELEQPVSMKIKVSSNANPNFVEVFILMPPGPFPHDLTLAPIPRQKS